MSNAYCISLTWDDDRTCLGTCVASTPEAASAFFYAVLTRSDDPPQGELTSCSVLKIEPAQLHAMLDAAAGKGTSKGSVLSIVPKGESAFAPDHERLWSCGHQHPSRESAIACRVFMRRAGEPDKDQPDPAS